MKNLLFALLVLFTFDSFSQNPEIKLPSKVTLGFTFSPDYCYRSLRSEANVNWIGDSRNDMEIPKLGFTTGSRILYTLGNRVSLESGLLFSDKGEKTKKIKYTTAQPDANAPEYGEHIYHYYYLDIPAKVNYYLTTQKVKMFVSAGTSANFFIAAKTNSTFTYSDGRIEKRKNSTGFGFNQVDFAALAGLGVDFALTENLQIRVEPIYRRSVVSIINTPIKSNLYSFGTNFGLFLSL